MQAKTVSKIVGTLIVLDLVICLAYLGNVALGQPSVKLSLLLDLEKEGNLPTWFSSMQLLLLAGTTTMFAAGAYERAQRGGWLVWTLPAVFLLMSIDEVAEIHEYLGYRSDALLPGGNRANTLFSYTGIWMFVLALPFLVLMLALFFRLRHSLHRGVFRKFVLGISLLVAGAAGGDLVANFVTLGSWAHTLEVFGEELAEMLGATLLLWAALDQLGAGAWTVSFPIPAGAVATRKLHPVPLRADRDSDIGVAAFATPPRLGDRSLPQR